MRTVIETATFQRRAGALLSADDHVEVLAYLSAHAWEGDVIPGTGGLRKLRIAASGRGKRGGAWVIYYVFDDDAPIYALAVYAKNEKADLTAAEKKALTVLAAALKREHTA
ncbi:type II toxin-antitoxin system RelE/ParE family toxin [Inquilinus sp. YAF38]|uniref:type II toxin-antitoxin system RelE/ParE family toxin n=1 Tax=Inquilinus sp. YAF38 TaxID=3233084 RepID=UPI003F900030